MNRHRIVIAVSVFVAVALAFSAGVVVQKQFQLAPIRAAEQFARDLTGLDDPVPPSPPWESWHYPGAQVKGSITGSSLTVNGKLVRPAGHYAIFVSRDKFEDVARFYAQKSGFEDVDGVASSRAAVSSYGTLQRESNHILDDFNDAAEPKSSHPGRAKCLIRRCPSYDLTVVLTRADAEDHTHILLLYDRSVESSGQQ